MNVKCLEDGRASRWVWFAIYPGDETSGSFIEDVCGAEDDGAEHYGVVF